MATINLSAENFERTVSEQRHRPRRLLGVLVRPVPHVRAGLREGVAAHPDIVFGKVDTEAEQALAAAAQITSIPTLMAFKDGTLVFSQPGALPAAALEQVITAVRDLDVEAALTEQKRSA